MNYLPFLSRAYCDFGPDWGDGSAVPGTEFRSGMELISVPEKNLNCSSSSFRRWNFFFSSVPKWAGTVELFVPGTGTVRPLRVHNN